MEKYAWKATIKDGTLEEYIKRHNNLPEDMKDVLHKAGICNYTIWNVGNELFGYYECKYGIDFAAEHLNVHMEKSVPVCTRSGQNAQCIGRRCPFAGGKK